MSENNDPTKQKRNGVEIGYRLLAFIGYWSPLMSLLAGFVSRKKVSLPYFTQFKAG